MKACCLLMGALALLACEDSEPARPTQDAAPRAVDQGASDARREADTAPPDARALDLIPLDASPPDASPPDASPPDASPPDAAPLIDAFEVIEAPPPRPATLASRTAGFKLYYRERVERAVLAFNRFGMYGDLDFASVISNMFVEREGARFEVVPGPKDNNAIGTSIWNTWQAYRLFRSRTLELTLIRMFNGVRFFEEVSGHPGMSARQVYPGWTLEIDGAEGPTSRRRGDQAVGSPIEADEALRDEIQRRFFEGVHFRYRLDPAEFYFTFSPLAQLHDYSITYSFSRLPTFLRESDCCSSLMRVPEGQPWAGAFWGNHNSRDNLPDLAFAGLAALAVTLEPDVDPALRVAAERALEAMRRITDMIHEEGNNLMTLDETGAFIVSGTYRPDREVENQDLGSLATCSMVYLAQAISSEGLRYPIPEAPLPGAILEQALAQGLGSVLSCEVPEGPPTCRRLDQAYCGYHWGNLEEMELLGQPWVEYIRAREAASPGAAEALLGGFQDDFYELSQAMLGILFYGALEEDVEVQSLSRQGLKDLAHMMRLFADLSWGNTQPHRQATRHYEAALFEAQAGLAPDPEVFADFAVAEAQMQAMEGLLTMAETLEPPPLLSDEALQAAVEARLAQDHEWIEARYRAAYGLDPPVRRAGEGYEARGVPIEAQPWHPVERPRHRRYGGMELLMALPICHSDPGVLDCSWALLGCARADLDESGGVDEADRLRFEDARARQAEACEAQNDWCEGGDLDRDGEIGPLDEGFMSAAQGCRV